MAENVSIILTLFKPNKNILSKIEKSIKEQEYSGKIKLIKIENLGLAQALNKGIRESKTNIVISLHQDCVPESKKWLSTLVEPLKEKDCVATVSKVELPYNFWKKFSFFAKIMSAKEQKIITPLLDEKGCAYKKESLEKVGLFDETTFKTAGEDFDMWIKLREQGKIAYPDCKVIHFHHYSFIGRLKKEFQLSEGFGTLARVYPEKMPKRTLGIIKAIPLLGWPIFLVNFPYKRFPLLGSFWIPLSILVHIIFCFGFWKGFIRKKQSF